MINPAPYQRSGVKGGQEGFLTVEGDEKLKTKHLNNEKGIAIVVAILLLLVVTLIGISAINTTTFEASISGNQRASEQAFYVAEAGINELMGRFRPGATNVISDTAASNSSWKLLLAKSSGLGATKVGYPSGDPNTTSTASLQSQLDFGVEVKHKVDAANQIITYVNQPVYIAKSYGFSSDGGNKVIEVEFIKSPSYAPPAALYSEMPVDIHGTSTYINGNDACGTTANKPGIITTTLTDPPISTSGNPIIYGSPAMQNHDSIPPPTNLPLNDMVNDLKGSADFSYSYTGNQTLTGYSDSWGIPTAINTETPISYPLDAPMKIVYFNMRPGNNTLKLAGGSHGAGILLVDGNLDINGGFIWYGVIIVTGSVAYTGGGQKNVTGGIMAGESATVEVDIGGNAGIIYCSTVANRLNQTYGNLPKITRWRDIF